MRSALIRQYFSANRAFLLICALAGFGWINLAPNRAGAVTVGSGELGTLSTLSCGLNLTKLDAIQMEFLDLVETTDRNRNQGRSYSPQETTEKLYRLAMLLFEKTRTRFNQIIFTDPSDKKHRQYSALEVVRDADGAPMNRLAYHAFNDSGAVLIYSPGYLLSPTMSADAVVDRHGHLMLPHQLIAFSDLKLAPYFDNLIAMSILIHERVHVHSLGERMHGIFKPIHGVLRSLRESNPLKRFIFGDEPISRNEDINTYSYYFSFEEIMAFPEGMHLLAHAANKSDLDDKIRSQLRIALKSFKRIAKIGIRQTLETFPSEVISGLNTQQMRFIKNDYENFLTLEVKLNRSILEYPFPLGTKLDEKVVSKVQQNLTKICALGTELLALYNPWDLTASDEDAERFMLEIKKILARFRSSPPYFP